MVKWDLAGMDAEPMAMALDAALQTMATNYEEAKGATDDLFEAGRSVAYFEMLDILRSQITAFGGQMDEVEPPVGRANA